MLASAAQTPQAPAAGDPSPAAATPARKIKGR